MSCSIDEDSADFTIDFDLPLLPIDQKSQIWNGREVEPLNSNSNMIMPKIIKAENLSSFYQRSFIDLTYKNLDDEEEEEIELLNQEWALAQAMAFIERNYREELTVEELLALRGLMFDCEQGRNTICKSVLKRFSDGVKKACHETKKGFKKAAKKAKEAAKKVIETAKDVSKEVAHFVKDVAKGTVNVVKDTIKTVEKGINDLSEGLCHAAKEVHQWCKEHPKVIKVVKIVAIVAAVVTATILLYPVIAAAATAVTEAIALAYTLAITAAVDMIDKMANRPSKSKEDEHEETEGLDVPNDTEASPFKSNFKTYLEDRQLSGINPDYVSQNNPYLPIPDAPEMNYPKTLPERPTSPPVSDENQETPSSGIWANILNRMRQGVEIIGKGMIETELRDPNTLLDLFHKDYADLQRTSGNSDQGKSDVPASSSTSGFTEMLQKFFSAFKQSESSAEGERDNVFKIVVDSIQKGLQSIGKGMCEPELLDPNSPLDILHKEYGEQLKEVSATHPPLDTNTLQRNLVDSTFYGLFGALEGTASTWKPFSLNVNKILEPNVPKTDVPTRSCYFKTEGEKIPGIGVGFTPGMNTSYEDALKHAYHIKKFAGDIDVYIEGVYNHSNGVLVDLCEIFFFNYLGIAPKTADLLIENWTRFFEENKDNPQAKYLQFAHSMGSIIVDSALRKAPKKIRDGIIVVTIGTAKVVPDDLCYKSFAYRSRSDFVHLGQDLHVQCLAAFGNDEEERTRILQELAEAKAKIIVLEPREDTDWNDHDCESPTNDPVFSTFIREYLQNNGEYK